jgi:hypothetical protein
VCYIIFHSVVVWSSSRFIPVGGEMDPRVQKAVRRKTAGKVIEDWVSKPRGDLPMHAWLNEKRKAKIQELVNKYFVMSVTINITHVHMHRGKRMYVSDAHAL